MMILIQNNQALVWLKKGIGDNTQFVTAVSNMSPVSLTNLEYY